MTRTTHPIGSGRPLHNRPFFDMLTVRLVSYRNVWLPGGKDYVYECVWSDGTETTEHTLPWGQMGNTRDVSHPLPDHYGTDDWEE